MKKLLFTLGFLLMCTVNCLAQDQPVKIESIEVSTSLTEDNTVGDITVTILGGEAPYIYNLSNGTIIESSEKEIIFSNLPANQKYWVVVEDAGHEIDVKHNIEITE